VKIVNPGVLGVNGNLGCLQSFQGELPVMTVLASSQLRMVLSDLIAVLRR
jgi:hypothetical protein